MKRRRALAYDAKLALVALVGGFPGSVTALAVLWSQDFSAKVQWTLTAAIVLTWGGAALALRERVIRPLQTLTNVVGALREGDYSVRGRPSRPDDALGEVFTEVNALSDTLREQRLGAIEANALLRQIMEEIDVAILAFDDHGTLRLINRAGERLVGFHAARALGRTAEELGIADCLQGEAPRTLPARFLAVGGPWELRRRELRLGGLPHQLVVLTDVSRAVREEERQAWQRLVRVLGHEINNSLAPIQSIASSLIGAVQAEASGELREDLERGLEVIARRAESLGRFMASSARLARLPAPVLKPMDMAAFIRRVADLEKRLPVEVKAGPELSIDADADQLEQVLINLVHNAVDAALETKGGVAISWGASGAAVEIVIDDEGPGLLSSANLFTPFFTTKPSGTGIGLVLSRQIAEAHHGSLSLENRKDRRGCRARLRLPVRAGARG